MFFFLLIYTNLVCLQSSRESLNKDDLKSTKQAIERVHTVCSREIGVASQASSEIGMLYQCARFVGM